MDPRIVIVLYLVSFICISMSFGALFGFNLLDKLLKLINVNLIEKITYAIIGLLGIYLFIIGLFLQFK